MYNVSEEGNIAGIGQVSQSGDYELGTIAENAADGNTRGTDTRFESYYINC